MLIEAVVAGILGSAAAQFTLARMAFLDSIARFAATMRESVNAVWESEPSRPEDSTRMLGLAILMLFQSGWILFCIGAIATVFLLVYLSIAATALGGFGPALAPFGSVMFQASLLVIFVAMTAVTRHVRV